MFIIIIISIADDIYYYVNDRQSGAVESYSKTGGGGGGGRDRDEESYSNAERGTTFDFIDVAAPSPECRILFVVVHCFTIISFPCSTRHGPKPGP